MTLLRMNPSDLDRSRSLLVLLALTFLLLAAVVALATNTHEGKAVWEAFLVCPMVCGIA